MGKQDKTKNKKQRKKQGNGNMSIKAKIIGTILPIIAILVIIMISLAYTISSNIIEKNATDLLDSSISYQSKNISAWLDENLASFSMAKRTIEQTKPTDEQLQEILDAYYGYNSNFTEGLYVADANGNVMKAAESTKTYSNVKETTWYKEGLSRVNMHYGSAYQSAEGENLVSASAILNDGSDNIRVISGDVSLQRITIIVNSFVRMDDAEAFLVDSSDGTILAHRDSSLISTKLDTSNKDAYLAAVAKQIKAGDYDDCEIEGNLTGFDTVDGTDWVLVSFVPHDVIYSDINSLRTSMIVIGLISLLVLAILVERVIHMVVKPVRSLTKTITTMADGDFTVAVDVKGRDEIGKMGRSVSGFIESIRSMLHDIQNISEQVSSQSDTTNDLSVEMNDVAKIQAESMRELSETVDQLSDSINEIAENATSLAMVVSDTKATSLQVEDCMNQTVTVSEKGKSDMHRVNLAMSNISQSIQKLDAAIGKVGHASDEITDIVSVIGNIAEETNLLSLNASIEAARAGEAGKGFAVVASEIGKLAQTSSESVENIVELIGEITRLVQETVSQAADSMKNIDESSEMIETALGTFEEIFADIHTTGDLIDQMMAKVGEVDEVATNVAAISQEQAASAEEIQATSENMVTQAKNIATSSESVMGDAQELSDSAGNLKQKIDKFKI